LASALSWAKAGAAASARMAAREERAFIGGNG
jgi:hypothetical protein